MESALWIFRGSSFHNLAAEVPKRRFPNRMDIFIYGTSDVNAVDRKDLIGIVNVEHVTKVLYIICTHKVIWHSVGRFVVSLIYNTNSQKQT